MFVAHFPHMLKGPVRAAGGGWLDERGWTMISGSWCLYERRSNRFIFTRRKCVLGGKLYAVLALTALCAVVHYF